MGPVSFCLTSRKVPGWVHVSSSSMTLTEAYSSAQEKMRMGDLPEGILETEAGQRLYSKGSSGELRGRVHGLQEAEEHSEV